MDNVSGVLIRFKDQFLTFTNVPGIKIGVIDIIEILIISVLFYHILLWIKTTRAWNLFKGLIIILLFVLVAALFQMDTILWLAEKLFNIGLVALVVIFQPELRRALEHLGRSRFVNVLDGVDKEEAKRMVLEMVEAIDNMSSSRTGALIVIEGEITLNDIVETGTIIDAAVSTEMIGNIFYEGAPLHDGALIVRGDRLYAAGCVLPLTQNKQLSKELGTRHRAGIGITENSDAMVIIVSEETGVISIAQNGNLTRFVDVKKIEKTLLGLYFDEDRKYTFTERINMLLRGGRNAKK